MAYLVEGKPFKLGDFARMKAEGEKIAVLTCYDASFAGLLDHCGVEVLLIGDSMGNVVQGHSSTLPVTMANVEYHTACVARGSKRAFIIADMPFGSFQQSPAQALENAVRLMAAGAHMVKLEGGRHMAETVNFLVERGIPVCAHIGLTPQSVHQLGGYRVQGRNADDAKRMKADAKSLEQAGAAMIVLEMVPAPLAAALTKASKTMATIGIGAGKDCDGQVLVLHDAIGIHPGTPPRFVRNFMDGAKSIEEAMRAYVKSVKAGTFPAKEHTY